MTTVTREIHFARKSRRKIIKPGPPPEPTATECCIPRVSKLLALAIRFDQMLAHCQVASMSELARLAHVTQPRMTQIMTLLHLAPDIQEEILHLPPIKTGRDPVTERDLRPVARQVNWRMQRRMWLRLKNSAE
ncbi:MAG: hypothetical protein R3C45_18375 [Phycisphaerales bacterium]